MVVQVRPRQAREKIEPKIGGRPELPPEHLFGVVDIGLHAVYYAREKVERHLHLSPPALIRTIRRSSEG